MTIDTRTIDAVLQEKRSWTTPPSPRPRSSPRTTPETRQAISAFVTLRAGREETTELIAELREHVGELIGPIARPKWIAVTPDLPKTRSGKIMRRLLRDIAENRKLGDTTTLADPGIVEELQNRSTEEAGTEA